MIIVNMFILNFSNALYHHRKKRTMAQEEGGVEKN